MPSRLATGALILHSGLEKWKGDETTAVGAHAMAVEAFPSLKSVPPRRFLRLVAATEIAVGSTLLVPVVPTALAGAALTGFSVGLLVLYLRTPALRKPGSLWPSSAGIGVSMDVWMLGVGLGLLVDAATDAPAEARTEAPTDT